MEKKKKIQKKAKQEEIKEKRRRKKNKSKKKHTTWWDYPTRTRASNSRAQADLILPQWLLEYFQKVNILTLMLVGL